MNDELEKAFECLRQKLCSPPVLSIPNIEKPYCVHTDASGFAVAAAIGQLDATGKKRPIAFASRKLSGPQLGWAYAIIWALNRFRNILVQTLLFLVTITHYSTSETVFQKVRICYDGRWHYKSFM